MNKVYIYGILLLVLVSCTTQPKEETQQEIITYDNPPAEGFNVSSSDGIAVILADKVMNAMGGRKAWDNTQYISWVFFDTRMHIWDKWNDKIRLENLKDDLKVIYDMKNKKGKVFKDGMEQTHADTVSKYIDWASKMWVNDSYWLVMPFKLKDSGVTLKYLGESQTLDGRDSEKIHLTFENVGFTPQNAYDIWVDNENELVTQWAYYPLSTDTIPKWKIPWTNYQKYGDILLSDKRGDYQLKNIKILKEVPEKTFESFDIQI